MLPHNRIFQMAARHELPATSNCLGGVVTKRSVPEYKQEAYGLRWLMRVALIALFLAAICEIIRRIVHDDVMFILIVPFMSLAVFCCLVYAYDSIPIWRLIRHLKQAGEFLGIPAADLPKVKQHQRVAMATSKMRELAERTASLQETMGVDAGEAIEAKYELENAYEMLRIAGWVSDGGYGQFFPKVH